MDWFWLSQLLVAIAIVCDLVSFQLPQRRSVLICLVLSTALTSGHYVLLTQYSGAILMLLASLRFALSIHYQQRRLMVIFIALSILTTLFVWQSPISLWALAGSCIQTCAAFQRRQLTMRLLMLLGSGCWLAYGVAAGSPVAALLEGLFVSSNVIALYRYRRQLFSFST
ncbi:YgjV family protein [Pseudoalteromonas sp. MM17-2]|uniref:YgjV family protein n=1 Tax=Pseudoalteromonas sp. MM17-2 TaxID=2917753 RepID=UPI001EF46D7D|nr:YgjV family protein [Pseudoalteromonas sp. MM17-2]MCG7545613.1 YgjV family protein [Pseudoalteromonas sp. MM17-2]